MRRSLVLGLALSLLCGCTGAEPSPSLSPEAQSWGAELPAGDRTLWLELAETDRPAGDGRELAVNIYEKRGDTTPLQHFEDVCYCSGEAVSLTVEDVNFDGYPDFHFIVAVGAWSNRFSSYYIWDEEQRAFQRDPYGLNDLCSAEPCPEEQVIRTSERFNIGTHETCFYRFEDGGLVCVRRLNTYYPATLEDGREGVEVTVEERRDGALTEVYRAAVDPAGQPPGGEIAPGFSRWYELDACGM